MADIQFPNVLFGPGAFTATVVDNNGTPASVLDAGLPFTIQCSWNISALAALLLGGEWQVAAYVEAIGPGAEQQVGPTQTVPLNGGTNYATNIVVGAGTLPNNLGPGQSGAYKLVTLLTHRNFGSVSDVAAVAEGPILRIS
ncbi:MAG TPA: hypothetical protein VIP75_00240 [Acidothermales bacterium]|jgi:hypothetical protein